MTAQKHVLIVEDEKPLARALELKLQHEGFQVTVAHDGQECLRLIQEGAFDVILLDLMMPVLDGFQVLGQLKEKGPMPYVIVLSNLSQHEDEQRVLDLGAKKYFIKSDMPLAAIVDEIKKA